MANGWLGGGFARRHIRVLSLCAHVQFSGALQSIDREEVNVLISSNYSNLPPSGRRTENRACH